ncbi:hypothetical protein [Phormidesmis priestleyi]|nr:hypothetical protein [Phormidesmis priestleyi]
MNSLTIDNTALKADRSEFATQSPKSRGLIAQWFTVDGKLVCKWFPAES